MRYIKPTDVGFRVHVKVASRIVSYRNLRVYIPYFESDLQELPSLLGRMPVAFAII